MSTKSKTKTKQEMITESKKDLVSWVKRSSLKWLFRPNSKPKITEDSAVYALASFKLGAFQA